MKRLVITGATSMLGIAIMEEALTHVETERIYAVVRPNTEHIIRLPRDERIQQVTCSAEDYTHLSDLINEPCDALFHTAWLSTGPKRNTDIIGQAKNIAFTLDALHAAKTLGCRQFVATGSQAEYGNPDVNVFSPETPANPVQPYGIAKYAAGKLAMAEACQLGIGCCWVRVFSVFGRYDKPTMLIPSTIKKMRSGEHCAFTQGTQLWDYLYDRDAGKALYLLGNLDRIHSKIYCLGSGISKPLHIYVEQLRDLVQPDAVLGFGEITLPDTAPRGLCADVSAIKQDTGWQPQWSFTEGICDLLERVRLDTEL